MPRIMKLSHALQVLVNYAEEQMDKDSIEESEDPKDLELSAAVKLVTDQISQEQESEEDQADCEGFPYDAEDGYYPDDDQAMEELRKPKPAPTPQALADVINSLPEAERQKAVQQLRAMLGKG